MPRTRLITDIFPRKSVAAFKWLRDHNPELIDQVYGFKSEDSARRFAIDDCYKAARDAPEEVADAVADLYATLRHYPPYTFLAFNTLSPVFKGDGDYVFSRPSFEACMALASCEIPVVLGDHDPPAPVMTIELPARFIEFVGKLLGALPFSHATLFNDPGGNYILSMLWGKSTTNHHMDQKLLAYSEDEGISTLEDGLRREPGSLDWIEGVEEGPRRAAFGATSLLTRVAINYAFFMTLVGDKELPQDQRLKQKLMRQKKAKKNRAKALEASAALAAFPRNLELDLPDDFRWTRDVDVSTAREIMETHTPHIHWGNVFPLTGGFRQQYYGKSRTSFRWEFRRPVSINSLAATGSQIQPLGITQ